MTAQTCGYAQHATLSGTTADSVTFGGTGASLCVTNHNDTTSLYFTVDGATAVSGADNTYVVRPGQAKVLTKIGISGGPGEAGFAISVVGNGNAYSAEIY